MEQWKSSPYRKPLILQGARQVGKTYAVLEFGKGHYENVAYFNFQTNPALAAIFEEDISPDYLLPVLAHICGQTITRGQTLIVFDEVQLCGRALNSLKYFSEQAQEYHLVAIGSLLEVAINREGCAFPVGKVDRITMHPMDMEEFLLAMGHGDLVIRIRECFDKNKPMPAALHDSLIKLYHQYLVIGGMPEAVARYIDTHDYTHVRHVQDTIQMDNLNDMSTYQKSSNEIKKTRLTYSTVAEQLSKNNKRFQYKLMKTGARATEYENAIQWLLSANQIAQVYRARQIQMPLEDFKDIDDFKIYLCDPGLLCAQKGLHAADIFYSQQDLAVFKEGMTENYVYTQLMINGIKSWYWRDEKTPKEVAFIIVLGGKIIPVDIKHSERKGSDSLNDYVNKYRPAYSIRISEKNFGFDKGIKSVPLYAVFCIAENESHD